MQNHRVVAVVALFLSCCAPAFTARTSAAQEASARPAGTLTITENTEIPDRTLKPGTYSISVLDQLADRMIVQVDEGKGKSNIFLAVPSATLSVPTGGGAVLAPEGKHDHTLLGYAFPDGTVAEFVYPKAAAVDIAKRNNSTVPAIDPASEGRPALHQLSPTDMRMVTLWMLTPTRVGSTPAMSAVRYQPPAVATASTSNRSRATANVASDTAPPPTEVASVEPKPKHVLRVLPHTASDLPIVWLITAMSLASAFAMTFFRKRLV